MKPTENKPSSYYPVIKELNSYHTLLHLLDFISCSFLLPEEVLV